MKELQSEEYGDYRICEMRVGEGKKAKVQIRVVPEWWFEEDNERGFQSGPDFGSFSAARSWLDAGGWLKPTEVPE